MAKHLSIENEIFPGTGTAEVIEFFNKKRVRRSSKPDKHIISDSYLTMYFEKSSFLVAIFDKVVNNLISTGHIEDWSRKYKYDYPKQGSDKETLLTLEHMYGVLWIISVLHAISFVVFLFELLSTKYPLLQNVYNQMN